MVNVYQINVKGDFNWSRLNSTKCTIIQSNDVKINDYILFRNTDEEDKENGLFMMTQIVDVIQNDGLKDGNVLIMFNKV